MIYETLRTPLGCFNLTDIEAIVVRQRSSVT